MNFILKDCIKEVSPFENPDIVRNIMKQDALQHGTEHTEIVDLYKDNVYDDSEGEFWGLHNDLFTEYKRNIYKIALSSILYRTLLEYYKTSYILKECVSGAILTSDNLYFYADVSTDIHSKEITIENALTCYNIDVLK